MLSWWHSLKGSVESGPCLPSIHPATCGLRIHYATQGKTRLCKTRCIFKNIITNTYAPAQNICETWTHNCPFWVRHDRENTFGSECSTTMGSWLHSAVSLVESYPYILKLDPNTNPLRHYSGLPDSAHYKISTNNINKFHQWNNCSTWYTKPMI